MGIKLNSTHFITTHTHGSWFYLNSKNWGKTKKYTVHHNRYPIIGTSIGPAE